MDEIAVEIEQLENKLGIPEHFFECLLEEDDWSFIIKAHALIESAITHLLVGFFSNTELEDIFARLELGNTSYGKIVFMKRLQLLTDDERRFIQTLSELRNKIVHNVRNVNFSFMDYISKLDKNQKDNFIRAFGYAYLTNNNGVYKVSKHDTVIEDSKLTIWQGLKYILAVINMKSDTFELKRSIQKHKETILENMPKNT